MLLVPRYVAGDLSRSERAEFEAWLVASPELASEVEMERRLRRGIASAARRGWLRRSEDGAPIEFDGRWRTAIAAGFIFSVAVGVSLLLPRIPTERAAASHERAPAPAAGSLLATRAVRLGSVRGGVGTSPDLTVSRGGTLGQLVIEPDVVVLTCEDGSLELECAGGSAPQTPEYAQYELDVVSRFDARLAWRSPMQTPDRSRLSFTLRDPGSLEAGDYDLVVRGHSAEHEEVVARFWLRVD